MFRSARPIHSLVLLFALGAGAAAGATTSLTVHNQTGRTLTVRRPCHPWQPGTGEPPLDLHGSRQWLKPGAVATYCYVVPGKDLESDLVIRRLPLDGLIEFEGVTIQAMDPELEAIGEELPPEPEA